MRLFWLMLIVVGVAADLYAHYTHQPTLTKWIVRYVPDFVFWLFALWASLHMAWFYYRYKK